ncbi:HNH endonuclease [Herbaspirillum huttiense]|uniref:HNH endonuclease n=1 Tax=Herbaspirillum huttiense TaxID=863372 RepID=UPI001E44ED71|nr:HNH endonuclease [Herbaspirillum huttiense]
MTLWAKDAGLIDGSLTDVINLPEFLSLSKKIEVLPIFEQRNATGHHMYSSALTKYSQYLSETRSSLVEEDIDAVIESVTLNETEKKLLIKGRIGQGHFRGKLVNYWKACSVTGYTDINLLVASHIKPWAVSSNKERTDVFNGLLLLPNLDRAFDQGYISFEDSDQIIISTSLCEVATLGISANMRVNLHPEHLGYMQYHRQYRFKK